MTEAAPSSAPEWYIITDDAALTLRITPGLTLGEETLGELALSHHDTAAQWVRFDPALDGTLTLTRLDEQATLTVDGEPADGCVEVSAGTLIQLPNNRLLISNHFRGQVSIGTTLRIRHESAYQGPPLLTTGVNRVITPPTGSMAARPAQGPSRAPQRTSELRSEAPARPATQAGAEQPAQQATVAAQAKPSREWTSAERLEDALSRRRDQVGSLLRPQVTNPTEEALVPVAAEAPFNEEELQTFLEQPIDLRETGGGAIPTLTTTSLPRTPTAVIPGQPTRRNYFYIGTLVSIVVFGLISALLAALLNQPADSGSTELPPLPGESLVLLPVPGGEGPATQVQRPTDALLRSVDKVLAEGDATDVSVWDFAIRTYEFVLAQEPDNAVARLRLGEAQQQLASLKAGALPQQPILAGNGNSGSVVEAIAEAAGSAVSPALPAAPLTAAPLPAPLTAAQSAMLDRAEERLEYGQVISPNSAAAVPLILGVLRDQPTNTRAVNLLNRSADLLLREAEAAWAANNQYLARNILEEVFAFHPRHTESNLRWTEWTGLPPRVPPAAAAASPEATIPAS